MLNPNFIINVHGN